MSETAKTGVVNEVLSLNVSPKFNAYTNVHILTGAKGADGHDVVIKANKSDGNGRVLTIKNPLGKEEHADAILLALENRGFRYQPLTASGALLNPAAELGDGFIVSNQYTGIYKMSRNYSPLMAADVEAPHDEEVDHEYPYEPKQDRVYRREIADAQAQISINSGKIESLVSQTEANTQSISTLEQTSGEISANVMRKSGGKSSSFSWNLTDSSWVLKANDSTVFKATKNGIEINAIIKAKKGGTIGGFTIGAGAIYKGRSSRDATAAGVYVGTDGISVGGTNGNFKVTSTGFVSASNMTLSGKLKIAGTEIDASALRIGAQSAYNNSGTWSTGAGYGYNYNSAASQNGTPASYFKANTLVAGSSFTSSIRTVLEGTVYILGQSVGWKRPQDATQVLGW